jgi:hypothetical protein
MRFAFASRQSWSSGFYTAYEHMSDEDLDLVVHLVDCIYERGWRRGREGMSMGVDRDEAVDLPSSGISHSIGVRWTVSVFEIFSTASPTQLAGLSTV